VAGAARPGGRGEGTLGVDAAHGRTFAPEDSQNPCTAVLSDAFWHGQLGGASIVGRTLIVNDESCLVVGIMPKDFSFYPKLTQLWMLIPPQGEYAKRPWSSMVGVVGLLAPGVTRASAEADITALQARIMGLVLCSIGVFGVVSQSVAQRRHEIGVRMALGALERDTLHLVLCEGMGLFARGMVIGVAAALALTRALSSLLYGITATDPLTLAAVAIFLMVVALAHCYLPARRAMRVDPMVALRHE
jgi:hypothetical protein